MFFFQFELAAVQPGDLTKPADVEAACEGAVRTAHIARHVIEPSSIDLNGIL